MATDQFIPYDIDYPFVWGLDLFYPTIARLALNIDGIDITENEKQLLRSLYDKKLLYVSNHPSSIEPPVAYYVANTMGVRFKFMASRNVFNWGYGLVGEMIKRAGAFSVLSGGADKDSIKMARSILSEESGKLAIYPEGMMTGENDNLVPFMHGVAQIGFWGLEDSKKKDPNADVLMLPVFVKYILSGKQESIYKEIDKSLQRIENALGIDPQKKNLLRRFLTSGRVLLEKLEKEYMIHIDAEKEKDYDYRMGRVRHTALNRAASILGIKFIDESENAIFKIREVFTALDSMDSGFLSKRKTHYNILDSEIKIARKDTDRAYTFLIIKPENLISYPSPERLIEWIYRFEIILFGSTKPRLRRARVLVANPFGLNEFYKEYKENKKATVEKVTVKLREEMENLLKRGISYTVPLVKPFDIG